LLCEFVYTFGMSVPHAKSPSATFDAKSAARALQFACDTLQIEADALLALKERIANDPADPFGKAVELLFHCHGRVVVSGIGKSGHIARKIASTLASVGTPALFVHAAEASHGGHGQINAPRTRGCGSD
jgi:arabinose-5-phosphate isomerase